MAKKIKKYFLLYDVSCGEIILATSNKRETMAEILVVPYKITERQGKSLKNALNASKDKVGRILFSNEVEDIFNKLFHVCKACSFVTDRPVNKTWGERCEKCFREYQEEERKRFRELADHRKQVRKYRLHLNTLQGQIDAVPIQVIESNVKLLIRRRGKAYGDLAAYIGMSNQRFSEIFKNQTIKKEYLLKISEFLFVPVKKLLEVPRGFRLPYKDGVPKFWLDEKFYIRNYEKEEK